uniref:Uncharacterized protein n=1 Tax=Lepeophtheirus salmonis TaxID=72036 RepID=A0A0K2UMP8_LEPSM
MIVMLSIACQRSSNRFTKYNCPSVTMPNNCFGGRFSHNVNHIQWTFYLISKSTSSEHCFSFNIFWTRQRMTFWSCNPFC